MNSRYNENDHASHKENDKHDTDNKKQDEPHLDQEKRTSHVGVHHPVPHVHCRGIERCSRCPRGAIYLTNTHTPKRTQAQNKTSFNVVDDPPIVPTTNIRKNSLVEPTQGDTLGFEKLFSSLFGHVTRAGQLARTTAYTRGTNVLCTTLECQRPFLNTPRAS